MATASPRPQCESLGLRHHSTFVSLGGSGFNGHGFAAATVRIPEVSPPLNLRFRSAPRVGFSGAAIGLVETAEPNPLPYCLGRSGLIMMWAPAVPPSISQGIPGTFLVPSPVDSPVAYGT